MSSHESTSNLKNSLIKGATILGGSNTKTMFSVVQCNCLLLSTAELIFSDEDKQLLLDLHNEARSMVDPIATNMEEMVCC